MNLTKIFKPAKPTKPNLQVSPSVRQTLALLTFMLVIGVGSAIVGYMFGRESLKGITQPFINPFLNAAAPAKQSPRQGSGLLKERDILAKVKAQTSGVQKSGDAKKPKAKPSQPSPTANQTPKVKDPSSTAADQKAFPFKTENQGMSLEVRSLIQADDSLLLNVALKNNGSETVQFLYTFLDITDDQGQVLFAQTRGLPTEIQPKSETYVGTIRILDVPRNSVETVSLQLTDYPDQKINLELSKIPVLED